VAADRLEPLSVPSLLKSALGNGQLNQPPPLQRCSHQSKKMIPAAIQAVAAAFDFGVTIDVIFK
jgi:hypothetical protein